MDPPPSLASPPPAPSTTVLDILGEEIVRIIAPVSACMLLVVLLVSALQSSGDGASFDPFSVATLIDHSGSDGSYSSSFWDKLKDAVLSSLGFVAVITLLTFLLVFLFYLRCTACLKYYLAFSSFTVLAFFGGQVAVLLLQRFAVPLDAPTFAILLLNFAAVGVVAVFSSKVPISVTQCYLVAIGVLVAYWFTQLPEWTTFALLIAVAVYDIGAVLLPFGPLRLLLELAMSRDEELPALVYEARPVEPHPDAARRVWRQRRDLSANSVVTSTTTTIVASTTTTSILSSSSEIARQALPENETRIPVTGDAELTAPLVLRQPERGEGGGGEIELAGLGSSGAFKLGLGDFIFYSVLVGRAAQYDFMIVYACYLAILAGLGMTLLLLVFYRTAMPALPLSIALGVIFYFLTRVLLEVFVVQCSINLLML